MAITSLPSAPPAVAASYACGSRWSQTVGGPVNLRAPKIDVVGDSVYLTFPIGRFQSSDDFSDRLNFDKGALYVRLDDEKPIYLMSFVDGRAKVAFADVGKGKHIVRAALLTYRESTVASYVVSCFEM